MNSYLPNRGNEHSNDEKEKLLHISAIPEELNEDVDEVSPFRSAINKYITTNNGKLSNKRQYNNVYQSSTATQQNKVVGNKSKYNSNSMG